MTFEDAYSRTMALLPPDWFFSLNYGRIHYGTGSSDHQHCLIIAGNGGPGPALSTGNCGDWQTALHKLEALLTPAPAVIEPGPESEALPAAEAQSTTQAL